MVISIIRKRFHICHGPLNGEGFTTNRIEATMKGRKVKIKGHCYLSHFLADIYLLITFSGKMKVHTTTEG